MIKLARHQWKSLQAAHLERVATLADAYVRRRSRGEKHAVEDFLFTYYNLSPAKLKQWMPPLGMAIEVDEGDLDANPWLRGPFLVLEEGFASLDPARITAHTRELASWVAGLCSRVAERPARFRCLGLHEWAMVYRQPLEEIRHQGHDLRLLPEDVARLVESQAVCCTHYDAFRFFTPEARPLNAFQPVLETRLEMEQGGCLHTNMDLYKWSAKLLPWCGSDLVGECFANAWTARQLDMRASPYELRAMGYEPVRIETPEGRAEYESVQRGIAAASEPLRLRLAETARRLAGASISAAQAG